LQERKGVDDEDRATRIGVFSLWRLRSFNTLISKLCHTEREREVQEPGSDGRVVWEGVAVCCGDMSYSRLRILCASPTTDHLGRAAATPPHATRHQPRPIRICVFGVLKVYAGRSHKNAFLFFFWRCPHWRAVASASSPAVLCACHCAMR